MQNRQHEHMHGMQYFSACSLSFSSRARRRTYNFYTEGVGRVRGAAGVKINSRGRRFTAQGAAQRARQCVCCIRGCERVHVLLLLRSRPRALC
jgi:hypothetical protein